jgi:hypothetical protein
VLNCHRHVCSLCNAAHRLKLNYMVALMLWSLLIKNAQLSTILLYSIPKGESTNKPSLNNWTTITLRRIETEQIGVTVTVWTCKRKVLDLNLLWDTGYSNNFFFFSHCFLESSRIPFGYATIASFSTHSPNISNIWHMYQYIYTEFPDERYPKLKIYISETVIHVSGLCHRKGKLLKVFIMPCFMRMPQLMTFGELSNNDVDTKGRDSMHVVPSWVAISYGSPSSF